MADHQHEALSALVDGELDAAYTETLVDALCRDDELAAEWHRLHRLRSVLKGDDLVACDVTAAVRAALAAEPTYLLPVQAPRASRWPRYAMGGALAASVALLTVIGLRPWQGADRASQVAQSEAPQTTVSVDPHGELATVAAQQPNTLDRYWAVYNDNALFAEQDSPLLAHSVRADQEQ